MTRLLHQTPKTLIPDIDICENLIVLHWHLVLCTVCLAFILQIINKSTKFDYNLFFKAMHLSFLYAVCVCVCVHHNSFKR